MGKLSFGLMSLNISEYTIMMGTSSTTILFAALHTRDLKYFYLYKGIFTTKLGFQVGSPEDATVFMHYNAY